VRCPHCCGTGTQGLNMSPCNLCKGDCTVSRVKDSAYARKYGRHCD
jgi:DnaJ-class molecular chaperone